MLPCDDAPAPALGRFSRGPTAPSSQLARDSRTACEWQSFTNDQEKFQETFPDVFGRLGLLGVDQSTLIDCSEVIPQPPPLPASVRPHFPAGKTRADVEQAMTALRRELTVNDTIVMTPSSVTHHGIPLLSTQNETHTRLDFSVSQSHRVSIGNLIT